MPIDAITSFLIILIMALVTFATRVVPFLIFPKGKEVPKVVQYLGRVLTPAVIGLLVVYCLRETNVLSAPYGLPELIAGVTVVVLHVWKRNNLLSIGAGTAMYMVLIQTVFV
jgi:Predicted branched-chain amino acid permeases (azaleucine resistance)